VEVQFRVEVEVVLLPLRASPERLHWYRMVFRWCSWLVGNDASQTGSVQGPCQERREESRRLSLNTLTPSRLPDKYAEHTSDINILPPSTYGSPYLVMAMLAVLSTAELLDCILQHLDPNTLLLAQRVNHQWQKAIQSDPWCQDKLFYTHRPTRAEPEPLYLWNPKKNRLKRYILSDPPRILRLGRFLLAPITLNPLLTEEILPLELWFPQDHGQRLYSISISTLLKSPHGSWRSMFISSPPATKIIARSVFCWHDGAPA
jgi:hypothetical protein